MSVPQVLSSVPATPGDRRLAGGVVLASVAVFVALAPFAERRLPQLPAFIPLYQSALVIIDLITAALLFAQHHVSRSRPLFVLACGYVFTALLTVAHTLTFPGLFSATGLLGAGPQTTAWLYMLWHAVFPMFVVGYAVVRDEPLTRPGMRAGIAALVLLAFACVALATLGQQALPGIMRGHGYASPYVVVVTGVWACSAIALAVLWRKSSRTVLDVWLMVTMCVWICEVGLAAVLNAGRFDLGFYAGRVYGLLAAAFVLVVLLAEYTVLFARLAEAGAEIAARREREKVAEERRSLLAREREARAEAELANRSKDEFLAMLGHELRNPLAPIRTALHLMRLRGADVLAHERQIIERQVTHLVRLVDDLLDVARIARGAIHIRRESVDVTSILARAIEMASPLIEQREHDLTVDVPAGLGVSGDAERLAQVVGNLLINAAKYTRERGRIVLSAAREDDEVVIRVRDSGEGLAPDAAARIFEPFVQQRQGSDRAQGGLGLGLAIVRSLVHLHGGTVAARSDGPGQGSEFTVRLPALALAPRQAAGFQSERPAAPAGRGSRVLIVDDNVDAAQTLAELVRLAGNTVRVAHDGPEALRLAAEFQPEVSFLDIGLPVMDGVELLRALRQQPALKYSVMAAVTGYGQEADRKRTADAGFDFHLVKPVDADRVLSIIAIAQKRAASPAASSGDS